MSKHTPGAWKTDIEGKTAYVVDADENMAVCKVMYARPEGPANARLIAQAPRLLEALEECIGAIQQFQFDHNTLQGSMALSLAEEVYAAATKESTQ